ncbi:LOW QUALITY PROTEIN: uncharacterized protein LOC128718559 [Anopheles marshallii]|uniref:LOW QUALITY PROTEIN: uncharacterized protein LOC128718559 n=1 Tax=Anopheles marshallii TaxID=1521116 RepID=UPI00237B8FC7|nr:LOW QUALITY PROTEIN: uncharacterized protein LOC128718559 [Anopheles marshallii]
MRQERTYTPVDPEVGYDEAVKRRQRHYKEKYFEKKFMAIIGITPPTSESLEDFDNLLRDEDLHRLEDLTEIWRIRDTRNAILEPKSLIYYARLQRVLVQMLQNTAKYRDYLQRFIIRFQAANEVPVAHGSGTVELDAPVHCAVRQLNATFLDWLLPRIDVNARNRSKQTALALLCVKYDQYMRRDIPATDYPSYVVDPLGTIRTLIITLLQAGALFNICSSHVKLPFELLLEHCKFDEQFSVECLRLARGALAICSINDREERVVGFYENNPNVIVNVELLEIFLHYKDRNNFATYMEKLFVDGTNVKKVIRLLLHTACEENLSDCVRSILDRGELAIFRKIYRNPVQAENNEAEDFNARWLEWLETELVQDPPELEHRVELKGLLKKVCLMGDLSLLHRFLAMISDPILLNEDPLLVHTLSKAHGSKCPAERVALLGLAADLMQRKNIDIFKKDSSGNTSLHLAIKYRFDSVSQFLLRQQHSCFGMRNKDNLTPLDYGTYDFWVNYLNTCIDADVNRSVPDRDEIRFDLNGFYSPPHTHHTPPILQYRREHLTGQLKPRNSTVVPNEMTALQHIANSKKLKHLLLHPVLNTFIMVKWTRLGQWNFLNLLLTALTALSFVVYSLTACSADGPSTVWLLSCICGLALMWTRELLQLLFLGRAYISFENALVMVNAVSMVVVLAQGCTTLTPFVIVSLSIQLTFLMVLTYTTKFAMTMFMFRTVLINFLKSFGCLSPVIGGFMVAFYVMYTRSPAEHAQDDFHSFTTIPHVFVKTLAMFFGEFDASSIKFDGAKIWLFVLFLLIVAAVSSNLINAVMISDIVAIWRESELISISKKVMLLEQYERGVANLYPAWLKRCFPKPFFAEYQCRIHIKTKEHNKIMVHVKPPTQTNSANGAKVREMPIVKFPWHRMCNIPGVHVFRESLRAYAPESVVDEALSIIEKEQASKSSVESSKTKMD